MGQCWSSAESDRHSGAGRRWKSTGSAAKPGIKHIVFDQMNHVLKRTEKPGKLEQLPLYSDPSIPLHPKLVDELVAFLKQSFGK